MTERPVLFQGAMVRALLAGTKTQTRRAVRKQFAPDATVAEVAATTPEGWQTSGHSGMWWDDGGACIFDAIRCPYGIPGDRLWVRERWNTSANVLPPISEPYIYGADLGPTGVSRWAARWKPSIHMPRDASRITLEITGVRVERLQDISADDARAEGCPDRPVAGAEQASIDLLAKLWYHDLWHAINGPESWAANPWVWVVEFKRVQP